MPTHVTTHGPIFDGRAELVVAQYIHASEKAIADRIKTAVVDRLDVVIRVNTHHYTGKVQVKGSTPGLQVDDSGIVYGRWLEGTGSRNRTTRFKGYKTFRLIRDAFRRGEAKNIAERELKKYVGRL